VIVLGVTALRADFNAWSGVVHFGIVPTPARKRPARATRQLRTDAISSSPSSIGRPPSPRRIGRGCRLANRRSKRRRRAGVARIVERRVRIMSVFFACGRPHTCLPFANANQPGNAAHRVRLRPDANSLSLPGLWHRFANVHRLAVLAVPDLRCQTHSGRLAAVFGRGAVVAGSNRFSFFPPAFPPGSQLAGGGPPLCASISQAGKLKSC
jgi:hypothetical protein